VRPIEESFFDGKRPWSRVKDRVLGSYLPPYLRKLQRLQRPIVIVDCFAGRGKFSDGTYGSPLIICQQIRQHAPGHATAYFINKRPAHHETLSRTLKGFIDTRIAYPILGQGEAFLTDLAPQLRDQTLFVYLDPFGIKGCNFAATRQLLQRNASASTELLMTLSMPVLHRLAAKTSSHAIVPRFHAVLDSVLGNIPWRDIMHDDVLSPADKESHVIYAYCQQLRRYTRYACACPVRDRDDRRIKYYIVFASRHADALLLMNDIMLSAYHEHTVTQAREDLPLFAPLLDDWRATRITEQETLGSIITNRVNQTGPIKRRELWKDIVVAHFMQYREAEFREAVQTLVNNGAITAEQPTTGRRLNDDSMLRPTPKRAPAGAAPPAEARRSS
jgi:three-Cys-motif partner protein